MKPFQKVLIADDVDTTNQGILPILNDFNIPIIDQAQYCDNALLKIKKGLMIQQPYDLLISDLSFKEDFRECKLKSGIELIDAAKKEDPDLKILVYSMETRTHVAQKYITQHHVDGFISKGRNGGKHLKEAIVALYENKTPYLSEEVRNALNLGQIINLTDYDIIIMQLLADGIPQKNIPDYLKSKNIKPNGLRSVENRLNFLRTYFDVKTTIQLILKVKEEGII